MSGSAPHSRASRARPPRERVTDAARELARRILEAGARRVAFLGLAKNAGKTTALVTVLEALHAAGTAAGATSVGRDGEEFDALTGEPKPSFRVWPGQLVASARETFTGAAPPTRLVRELSSVTRFGPVEVRRVEAPGALEIIGPTTVREAAEAADALESSGAARVLVDGAFGRRAFASARLADGIVLSVGMSAGGGLASVVEKARLAVDLVRLGPPAAGRPARAVDGALTERALRDRPAAEGETLVVEDFASVFLPSELRRRLRERDVRIAVRRPALLLAVTSNPFRPGRPVPAGGDLFGALCEALPGVAIVDVVADRRRIPER